MQGLRKALTWLLCLVMFASAVACTDEKGALGKNCPGIKTEQGKWVVSDGKHREKAVPA